MRGRSRLVGLAALGYVAVSLVTILGSIALAPWFDVATNALSDLGMPGRRTAPIFNGGLILGGLLGAAVGAFLAATRTGIVRVGGGAFVLTMGLRAGIGVFPTTTALHAPIAIAYFAGLPVSLWTLAVGAWRGSDVGESRTREVIDARLAVAAGALVPAVWLSWGLWWASRAPGLALPEILSSLGLLAWLAVLGGRLRGWV